jgi:TonB family protein
MNYLPIIKKQVSKLAAMLLMFLAFSFAVNAQNQDATVNTDSVYSIADKMPEFPGGEKAMLNFIFQKTNYPSEAQKKKQEGKVILQFIVDKTGKVKNAKVIRSIAASLDKEALRVVNTFPVWTPGEQNGQKVSVIQTLPIAFKYEPIGTDSANWTVNEKTLVVIDGVNMPKKFNISILNTSKLTAAVAIRPFPKEEKKKLIDKYGRQAADGVLLITTNKYEMYFSLADSTGCKEDASTPKFIGGNEQLLKYIADSIQYPFAAKELKTEGKVFVRFRIDKAGRVCDIKVLKSLDYFLDKEALRVINTLPNWIPGKQCNKNVDIIVTMPVTFKIAPSDTEKPRWRVTEKTVILLDGERLPAIFDLGWLNYTGLSSYKVLEPSTKEITKKLVSKYGKDAANGVVLIVTKEVK